MSSACSRTVVYSITWSARASSDCGIVRPRALAVLRLTTSSNFVGCTTGRSAGLDAPQDPPPDTQKAAALVVAAEKIERIKLGALGPPATPRCR